MKRILCLTCCNCTHFWSDAWKFRQRAITKRLVKFNYSGARDCCQDCIVKCVNMHCDHGVINLVTWRQPRPQSQSESLKDSMQRAESGKCAHQWRFSDHEWSCWTSKCSFKTILQRPCSTSLHHPMCLCKRFCRFSPEHCILSQQSYLHDNTTIPVNRIMANGWLAQKNACS